MRVKEDSLRRALEATALQQRGLPPRYTEGKDGFWIKALVLVQKRSLEECYCLYQQNADKYMRLVQDFGTPSPIMTVKSIHPFLYLDDARFIPVGSIADKKDYLKRELGEDTRAYEVDDMTPAEVNHLCLELAIEQQLNADEHDRQMNIANEGSDLDGTNIEDIERQQFEIEYAQMKKDGCSKAELKAFKADFDAKHKPKDVVNPDDEAENEPSISEADRLRMEMESRDLQKEQEKEFSVEGEFDAPKLDYEAVKAASEEYRKEQIRIAKRKWKRDFDGNRDLRAGFSCENEQGEKEEVETLQLPENKVVEVKRKPGRPKKVKATTTRKRRTTTKK